MLKLTKSFRPRLRGTNLKLYLENLYYEIFKRVSVPDYGELILNHIIDISMHFA